MKLQILTVFLVGTTALLLIFGVLNGNGWMTAIGGVSAVAAAGIGLVVLVSMTSTKIQDRTFNNALRNNATQWRNLRNRVARTLGTRNAAQIDQSVYDFADNMGVSNPDRAVALSNYNKNVSDNWLRTAEQTEPNQFHPSHINSIRENAGYWVSMRDAIARSMTNPTKSALDKKIGSIATSIGSNPERSVALSMYQSTWAPQRLVQAERTVS